MLLFKVSPLFLLLFCFLGSFVQSQETSSSLSDQIDSLIGEFNKSLDELLHDLKDFGDIVGECFEANLTTSEGREHRLDISNRSLNFKSIVSEYYEAFPDKSVTRAGITNLLDSTRDMTSRCSTRNHPPNENGSISSKGRARYGFTSLSDKSIEEMKALLGLVTLPLEANSDQLLRRKRLSGDDARCQPRTGDGARETSVPESFDWRDHNVVTPVRNQRDCGSCWTFASLASLESALLINNATSDTAATLDLSEQQLIECAKFLGTGCEGGNSYLAFTYLKISGVTSEANMPYRAADGLCPRFRTYGDEVSVYDYCIRSRNQYTFTASTEELTEEDMVKTLVHFGPLYVAMNANPLATRNYRGGVYDGADCTKSVNHAVTLVGYTPDAWIIKNSWGPDWGEGGYFKLGRGSNENLCGIQTEIAWPLL